ACCCSSPPKNSASSSSATRESTRKCPPDSGTRSPPSSPSDSRTTSSPTASSKPSRPRARSSGSTSRAPRTTSTSCPTRSMWKSSSQLAVGSWQSAGPLPTVNRQLPTYSVVVALGSNLGDRAYFLRRAIHELRRAVDVVRVSSFIETDPVDAPPASPRFLNAVIAGATHLAPQALLDELLTIESRLGRRRPAP